MIGDAIFSEVGHNEAMILTWTIHVLLEHVPVGLLLASIWNHPRDSISEFDRWLNLFPGVCRALREAMSIMFLFPHIDQQASVLSVPWSTVDWVGETLPSVAWCRLMTHLRSLPIGSWLPSH